MAQMRTMVVHATVVMSQGGEVVDQGAPTPELDAAVGKQVGVG
jgi:hypothetical protein